jgi:lysophospholipase L1-like esterase
VPRDARGRRGSRVRGWAPAAALAAVAVAIVAVVLRPRDAGDRYVALGDSYAVGTGAASLDGYAPRFARWLRDRRAGAIPTFLNMGVGGENTTSLLQGGQLGRALDAIGDGHNRTRVVTLDIGTNELLAPECIHGVDVPRCPFRRNLTAILDELQTALREEPAPARLLVMGLFAPFPDAGPIAARSVRILLQGLDGRIDCAGTGLQIGMNDLIACIGARHGATYVETFATFARDPHRLISKDGLHPSDAGHAAIARRFAHALVSAPPPPPHAAAYR